MTDQPRIYLASIALEPNRWKGDSEKKPSFKVSEFSPRAKSEGFNGWELWEHHFHLAEGVEQRKLIDGQFPVSIFNTYLRPGFDSKEDWMRVVDIIALLGPRIEGIKFNLGNESVPVSEQISAAMEWAEMLPAGVKMYCECHPGTVLENPEDAQKAFKIWPEIRFASILHPMNNQLEHCARWFSALGSRIEHLHWQARGPDNKVCYLSEAQVQFEHAITALIENSYAGTHSVEFVKGTGQLGENPQDLLMAASEDLRVLAQALKKD